MGQWGEETYSCDSVMDFLQHYPKDGDLTKMTQKMADKTLDNVWINGSEFDRLGVVVWLLNNEFVVTVGKLKDALRYANDELDPTTLDNWVARKRRKEIVAQEMTNIRLAIGNKGKGKKRETRQILDFSEKAESGERTIELPCYGIIVNLTGDGGADITSDMAETCPYCNDPACDMGCPDFGEHCSDRDKDEQLRKSNERFEFLRHRAAIDALESLILAHAGAGIDITTPAYIEGIETVQQALTNTDYTVEEL